MFELHQPTRVQARGGHEFWHYGKFQSFLDQFHRDIGALHKSEFFRKTGHFHTPFAPAGGRQNLPVLKASTMTPLSMLPRKQALRPLCP